MAWLVGESKQTDCFRGSMIALGSPKYMFTIVLALFPGGHYYRVATGD